MIKEVFKAVNSKNVIKQASLYIKDNCIITGGHFRIFFKNGVPVSCLNNGTLLSFDYAVKLFLYAAEKKIKTELGILINDMGYSCEEDICDLKTPDSLRKDYTLPDEYIKILLQNGLGNYSVKIFWEKHIRNRGKKWLIKLLKDYNSKNTKNDLRTYPQIIKEKEGMFLIDPEGYGKIIITKIQGRDKYGTPACPLIMASLGNEHGKLYSASINFYYIGEDNIDNIPNYFVIEKGSRICELLGCNIQVKNLYIK